MGIEKDGSTEQTSPEDTKDEQSSAERAAEQAAFEESFDGTPTAAETKPADEGKPDAEAVAKPDAQPGTEAAPPAGEETKATGDKPATEPTAADAAQPKQAAPSQEPPAVDLQQEVRKLHGRIGALNDQLQKALAVKQTEGKPAVLTDVQLTRLKGEYPELADLLEGDITKIIGSLAERKTDPVEIEKMVADRVEAGLSQIRADAVTDRHENWMTDCWADKPGGTRTPVYEAWLKTMTPAEAEAFENSQNPSFVSRKLDQFYKWREETTKANTEKQDRLNAAITPKGVPRAGPATISDEEAERAAFDAEFNR